MEFLTKKKAHELITKEIPNKYKNNNHFSVENLLEAVYVFVKSLPKQQMRTLFLTASEYATVSNSSNRARQKEGTWFTVFESAQAMYKGPKAHVKPSSNPLASNKSKMAKDLHKCFEVAETGEFAKPLKSGLQLLLLYVVKLTVAKFGEVTVHDVNSNTFPQRVLNEYANCIAKWEIWRKPICVPEEDLAVFQHSTGQENPKIFFAIPGGKLVREPKTLESFDVLPEYIVERKEFLTKLKANAVEFSKALEELKEKILVEENYVEQLETQKAERDFKMEFANKQIKSCNITSQEDVDNMLKTSDLLVKLQAAFGGANANETLEMVLTLHGELEANESDGSDGSSKTGGSCSSSPEKRPPDAPSTSLANLSEKVGGSKNYSEVLPSHGLGKGKGGLFRRDSERANDEEKNEGIGGDKDIDQPFDLTLKRKSDMSKERQERLSQGKQSEKKTKEKMAGKKGGAGSSSSEITPRYDSDSGKLVKRRRTRRERSESRAVDRTAPTDSE